MQMQPTQPSHKRIAHAVDFGDRETIPAELLDEPRLPCPEVTELFGEHGRRAFLEAKRLHGDAA